MIMAQTVFMLVRLQDQLVFLVAYSSTWFQYNLASGGCTLTCFNRAVCRLLCDQWHFLFLWDLYVLAV